MSWESWLARGVGYGLAPFTGGASIPIGEGVAQGLDTKDAITKANTQQNEATQTATNAQNNATKVATDVYNAARGNLQPYQALGGGAAKTLGELMGIDMSAATTPVTLAASAAAGTPVDVAPIAVAQNPPSPGGLRQMPAGMTSDRMATLRDVHEAAQLQSQSGYRRAGGGDTVIVRAPDGAKYQIPRAQLAEAISNGGQQVGA